MAGTMAGTMAGFAAVAGSGYARAGIAAHAAPRHGPSGDVARAADDRADIADALHRYAAGIDENDAGLLASSLDPDAVVDLSRATAQIGVRFPTLVRRDVVVGSLISLFGPMDTSHALTNLRITVDGDTAVLRCYAQTRHYPPGDGPRPDRTRNALMMNRYTAELVRCDGHWRIRHLVVDNLWFEGDPAVLAARL
ncbi:MAG: nuclear transport factor 2 family protein [Actinocrinis sp.]